MHSTIRSFPRNTYVFRSGSTSLFQNASFIQTETNAKRQATPFLMPESIMLKPSTSTTTKKDWQESSDSSKRNDFISSRQFGIKHLKYSRFAMKSKQAVC